MYGIRSLYLITNANPEHVNVQVKANFTGVLAEIARKAGAASAAQAPREDICGTLKAAISSIDAFGAEGSQAVSAEEVCLFVPHNERVHSATAYQAVPNFQVRIAQNL